MKKKRTATLQQHLEDSRPRIEFINQMMKDLPKLTSDVAAIKKGVDELQFVSIKNGEGVVVAYPRDAYFQMLYDRPTHTLNDATGLIMKIGNVARALTWFSGFVVLIWKFLLPHIR